MHLGSYLPHECRTGEIENCEDLIAYARFNTRKYMIIESKLQFSKTIFTCIVMSIGSLMFSGDTENIIIVPITKMVSIIKQLADDPLQKPEPLVFTPEELNVTANNQLKTVELRKTIYRIGKLLQMCFGQLGALIIRDAVSGGDGSLEIMIPGHRINVIFCVVKLQNYIVVQECV